MLVALKAGASKSARTRSVRRGGTRDAQVVSPSNEWRFALLLADAIHDVSEEEGLDPSTVRRYVHRLIEGAALQERRAPQARRELARTLGPSLADIDPIPYATIEQARRLAKLRAALLRSGAYSTAALADARGVTANNARQWISRHRREGRLFSVIHEGETLIPAFLLDEHLEPRVESQPAISALRGAGEDGWALWAWFATPTGWLGGRVPAELLRSEPEVVTEAARQRAAAVA
jgi:hypothetical protein